MVLCHYLIGQICWIQAQNQSHSHISSCSFCLTSGHGDQTLTATEHQRFYSSPVNSSEMTGMSDITRKGLCSFT